MNALLALLALAISISIAFFVPDVGPGAILTCLVLALSVGLIISRLKEQGEFLLRIFTAGLLMRLFVGTLIYTLNLQDFFGGDARTYDSTGYLLFKFWRGEMNYGSYDLLLGPFILRNWGMPYLVASLYSVVGRNMLAVQFFNAVLGAATAPVIFLCARHIFQNIRVAKLAAFFVAFFPSLVLWSSQGLKDGPIIFLLALVMLLTLRLGEQLTMKHVVALAVSLVGLLSFRFYIFYMTVAAIVGSFVVGMRPQTGRSLVRQVIVIAAVGLALMWVGVLRTASSQLETYGDLNTMQRSREDLAKSADSGFGKDVDVSTTAGALSAIPLGMLYLLFAPFPWQVTNLRQSITLPEMVAWWSSFPLLCIGVWFTLRYRMRQALPILIFTSMLTLAYSVFQGNVGTAYRQRSQILVFYFIFVAVGYVLMKEKREDRKQERVRLKEAEIASRRPAVMPRAPKSAPRHGPPLSRPAQDVLKV